MYEERKNREDERVKVYEEDLGGQRRYLRKGEMKYLKKRRENRDERRKSKSESRFR